MHSNLVRELFYLMVFRRKSNWLLVIFLLPLFVNASAIKVSGAHWKGYSEPDGTGIYLELIKLAYPSLELQFDIGSFARAKRKFIENKSDLLIGVYKSDFLQNKEVIFPKYHLDIEYPVVAIYNPAKNQLSNITDFNDLVVAWYEEYGYDKFVPNKIIKYTFDDIYRALKLLESGRIDVIIDHAYNLDENDKLKFKTLEISPEQPIWIAFRNTREGRVLRKIFDTNMENLIKSGQLKALFGDEYERAKFDEAHIE